MTGRTEPTAAEHRVIFADPEIWKRRTAPFCPGCGTYPAANCGKPPRRLHRGQQTSGSTVTRTRRSPKTVG